SSGLIKILDFGLARVANSQPMAQTVDYLTEVGQVLGTVGYMSPEQARGDVPDGRGDIFALGCILFEMATGRKAFLGRTVAEVMAAVLRDQPTQLQSDSRLPADLKELVAHCLAKEPKDRFQSAGDLAVALKNLTGGEVR